MKIHLTANRILIIADEDKKANPSGIVIPESTKNQKKPIVGQVIEVGPDVKLIQKGDKVVFSEYGFELIDIGGVKYQIGDEQNVYAVLENELDAGC